MKTTSTYSSKVSNSSNIASQIYSSASNLACRSAKSTYSASCWLGGKAFSTLTSILSSEQQYSSSQTQKAHRSLPELEVNIAEGQSASCARCY